MSAETLQWLGDIVLAVHIPFPVQNDIGDSPVRVVLSPRTLSVYLIQTSSKMTFERLVPSVSGSQGCAGTRGSYDNILFGLLRE